MPSPNLIIVGASARAAAFSARRAGLRPWCVDLFADSDLRESFPAVAVDAAGYPENLLDAIKTAPPAPLIYTGGIENYPQLVSKLAKKHSLWGNDAATLKAVRSPVNVAAALREAGLSVPNVSLTADAIPAGAKWLVKPLAGTGGNGIHVYSPESPLPAPGTHYYQEFVDGKPVAAVFAAMPDRVELLGVTEQLIGESWLRAAPFHYCGSIGPLQLASKTAATFEQMGDVLTQRFGLRGLFGVDAIMSDDVPWAVEVNPRYTASVEVLEYATGVSALSFHRRAFEPHKRVAPARFGFDRALGKAILYSRSAKWVRSLEPWPLDMAFPEPEMGVPTFADIPAGGQPVKAGRPILTLFAIGDTPADCRRRLRSVAAELEQRLYE